MADGKVVDNKDQSITYTPVAAFVSHMKLLVQHTGAGGAASGGSAAPAGEGKGAPAPGAKAADSGAGAKAAVPAAGGKAAKPAHD